MEDAWNPENAEHLDLLRNLAEHFKGLEFVSENVDIDDELREKLRALGYLR
jgi:hypothetical protein